MHESRGGAGRAGGETSDVSGDVSAKSAKESAAQAAEFCFDCHDPVVHPKFDKVASKFVSSLNKVHRDAGVTCDVCHIKHDSANRAGARPALDACAKCHAKLVDAYKAGEHFAAFSQIGFPHCSTCHDIHAPTDALTTDLTSPQETGLESTRATCLSCHFSGSEHERTIFKLEMTLDETDKIGAKLDRAIGGFDRLNSALPPFMRVKTEYIPDGERFREWARAELHGVGGGVDKNFAALNDTLDETRSLIGIALARVIAFYGTLILAALIFTIHRLRKAIRRRKRLRFNVGMKGDFHKD